MPTHEPSPESFAAATFRRDAEKSAWCTKQIAKLLRHKVVISMRPDVDAPIKLVDWPWWLKAASTKRRQVPYWKVGVIGADKHTQVVPVWPVHIASLVWLADETKRAMELARDPDPVARARRRLVELYTDAEVKAVEPWQPGTFPIRGTHTWNLWRQSIERAVCLLNHGHRQPTKAEDLRMLKTVERLAVPYLRSMNIRTSSKVGPEDDFYLAAEILCREIPELNDQSSPHRLSLRDRNVLHWRVAAVLGLHARKPEDTVDDEAVDHIDDMIRARLKRRGF